jgi:aspartyl protease family protein
VRLPFLFFCLAGLVLGLYLSGQPFPRAPLPAGQAPVAPAIAGGAGPVLVQRGEGGHFFVEGTVNDRPVRFVVDTGATGVALTRADAERAGVVFDPNRFGPVGRGASGPVRGELVTVNKVAVGGKAAFDVAGVVLEDGLPISLLGQSYLARLRSVRIEGDTMTLE